MIVLDATSPIPPFEQVRSQLADLICSGQLAGGQRLPSIRQLAGDLRVAPGTVARAYDALRASGLIETSRAAGTRVSDGVRPNDDLQRAAAQFVSAARGRKGVTLSDALGAVRAVWERAPSARASLYTHASERGLLDTDW